MCISTLERQKFKYIIKNSSWVVSDSTERPKIRCLLALRIPQKLIKIDHGMLHTGRI